MDQLDHAQALEERERDAALARFRRRQQIVAARQGRERCVDCDGKIEAERRRTLPNTVRCAACARAWAE